MNVNLTLPRPIKALDPQLVNRIAAGEIIQRPFNALKELIENSLDAGATTINIVVKEGGLKLIQIQDNGCGIDRNDLSIVCERFTTSKLKDFDDLRSLSTFGFRGEALASISHVARLSILTKTANSPCAYKASYSDGKLIENTLKPCAAASKGTQISAEDLFYNSLIRRNALRSSNEEFSKIQEVVSRYAIHNYHVSFTLKRGNENGFDLKTSGLSNIEKENGCEKKRCLENEKYLMDNIGIVFGSDLRKELERIEIKNNAQYQFEMNGYISNTKYNQLKQMVFILFINERLVDCQPLKKCLQTIFSLYMPKGSHPFVYMNLTLNPLNIDVNVHPTKHEIRFLHQDEIINKIQVCVEQQLLSSNVSKTYYLKNLTIDSFIPSSNSSPKVLPQHASNIKLNESITSKSSDVESPIVYPYQLSRVDTKEQTLDSFLHRKSTTDKNVKIDEIVVDSNEVVKKSPLRRQKLDRQINLKSLNLLRDQVENVMSIELRKIFLDFSFIGCVDDELGLIQHKTGLFLSNTKVLSKQLFYQLLIFNFGNFGYFRFNEAIPIFDIMMLALDDPESQWSPEDGEKSYIAKRCTKLLISKSDMLDDYFSIKIVQKNDTVYVETLPILVEDYEPNLFEIPMFMLRLAIETDWNDEKNCFESMCDEISEFYSIKNVNLDESTSKATIKPSKKWIIEHILYSKMFRNILLPSSSNCEESVLHKLVDLHDLYKVFERC